MRWHSRPTTLALLIAFLAAASAVAQQTPDKPATTKPAVSSEEIARWLNELGSQDFTVREQASRRLVDAGEAVVDPVTQLTDTDNLELAMRGLFILKEQFQSKDAAVKAASKKALEKLAASSRASVAKRAQAILNPPADNPAQNVPNARQLQFRFVPGIAGAQRIQVQIRNQNGRTEINVTENDTKVAITHTNGRDIVVKVTEPPKDGKEQPAKEFAAKDADELKLKHPEAHKHFEKYAAGNNAAGVAGPGQIQILAQGNIVPGGQPWAMLGPKTIIDTDHLKKTLQEIDEARTELQQLAERLHALATKDNADPAVLKKLADDMKAASERIKAARLKLLP
ncbi:MAG: hypothetical protein HZA46_12780 [Planctomycetales bacterium]|nr:hypothetical protein [Planctomycetales bacterium]